MSTLYELTQDWQTLLEYASDSEIDPQTITDTLESLDYEIEEKADGYAKVIRELDGQSDVLKSEIDRLNAKKSAIDNNIKRMKENLQEAMILTNKRKFKTSLFSFSIQKNGGKAPIILDVKDTSELPDELVRVKEEADLDAIRELLDKGECKYAHYGERGESLRIK